MNLMQQKSLNRPFLSLVVVWLLLFSLLVFASEYGFSFEKGVSNSELGAAEAGLTDNSGSSVMRVQKLAAYAICAGLAAPISAVILTDFAGDMLLPAILAFAVVSVAWSQKPSTTLLQSVYLALNMALAFYLLRRFSGEDLMKLFMLVGAVAAAGTLIAVVFFPRYGLQFRGGSADHGAWEGIFGHKNICGAVFTYLLTPAFFVRLSGRYRTILRFSYIFTLLFIVVMTRSAGAWLVCLATIAAIVAMRTMARMRSLDGIAVALCGCVVLLAVGLVVADHMDFLMYLIGKDPTMTGRTIIWANLIPSVLKRPWTGFGYMAFWGGLQGESANVAIAMNWPGISYSENGLLELCLSLGLIGVGLFLLLFARAVRDGVHCFRHDVTPEAMWFISILIFTVFANIEGGKLLYPSDLECILQYIAFIGLSQQRLRMRGGL